MIKIESVILALPKDAQVLDIGCFGYGLHSLCHKCGRPDIKNCGVDYSASEDPPAGYEFKKIDLNRDRLPYPDAHFDFVLASHVIEHLRDGVAFFAECCRVTKLGGRVMITCPSERSITLSGFPFDHDKFCSTSFFDDPTHLGRPYSPQSLFRLARYYNMEPEACGYDQSLYIKILSPLLSVWARLAKDAVLLEKVVWQSKGWASYLLARRPLGDNSPIGFRYYIPRRTSKTVSIYSAIKKYIGK